MQIDDNNEKIEEPAVSKREVLSEIQEDLIIKEQRWRNPSLLIVWDSRYKHCRKSKR